MSDVDPITLEVVKNALASTADEMALVIMRSAYSPVVRDTLDYSTALCDRDGRIVAQGLTLAVQLGTFPTVMGYVLEELGPAAQPGDVYIANDPYGCGGQHLPDIYVIKPVFVDGVLEGYAATMAHHSDVGGIAPGSIAVHATEIYQEGLRIPLSKLVDAGVENTTLLRLLEANTRQPTHVLGDLRAQLAACRVGERGLAALLDRYGAEAHLYMDELQRVAERAMRAELAALPDGVHTFTDFIDGVGDDPVPIPIRVRVEIAGDEVFVDFDGTSPQVDASVNCPVGMVYAACYCAFRGIARAEIPNCEGYMTPIHVHAPAGTVVNPVLPAACGARGVIGYRVYDAVMGALAPLVPDRVIAAGEGGPTLVALGGYDEDRRPFGTTEVLVGNWGARAERDGLEGVSNPLANLGNQPVELIEADQPLRVERYGLVPDSGGAGRHRGGLAYVREYTVLAERATLTIRTDRRDHPPYGLAGGEPGAPSTNVVVSGGEARELPTMPMEAHLLEQGDSFTHVSAGGGGFGDAFDRDPAAVLEDVLDGKVSVAAARERYGVVIAAREVDATSTAELRAARRAASAGSSRADSERRTGVSSGPGFAGTSTVRRSVGAPFRRGDP
jgi:N-methylhydantoinase B